MSSEFSTLSLTEFSEIPAEDLISAKVEGTNPSTGYGYSFNFLASNDERPSSVGINTESRAAFLEKGTEAEAEEALIELGLRTRKLTGGIFNIHPFFGAINGTKINPVAPGFLVKLARLDEGLSMDIDLSDNGYDFDAKSTKEAVSIGTTVVIPGPMAPRLLAYMRAPKANPNQRNRDQAVANNLGRQWDQDFKRFNGNKPSFLRKGVRPAIELTPATASQVIENLGEQSLLSEVSVTWLYTRQDEAKLYASFTRDRL